MALSSIHHIVIQHIFHAEYLVLHWHYYVFNNEVTTYGHKYAQVFMNGMGYILFYPLNKESNTPDALSDLIQNIGVPKELVIMDYLASCYILKHGSQC